MSEDMNERDAAGARLLHDAYTRWRDMPPARLTMQRSDAWVVMMGLQAAVSHPAIAGGPMAETMERVGRAIQEQVSDVPELYALAEAGWHRAYDVDPADEKEGRS